jgi:transcriptional regulator with GAF, ATPase, and Fis domain
MSKWKKLIEDHKKAQINMVMGQVIMGHTQSEAARNLGMPRQHLNRFCKRNGIKFKTSKLEEVSSVD